MLKLHLIDLLSICYTANFAAHTTDEITLNISTVRAISSSRSAKMGHVSKTTPLLGVVCYPFGKT